MLTYYVVYRTEAKTEPAGIFVMDVATGAAVLWNHRSRGWSYDPALVVRFLDDPRNVDRYEVVDLVTLQGLTETVTGSPLPDERALRTMLEEGQRSHHAP
ncbi:hypothetical protein [Micromonospora echinaurantiaca]|uniref:hypothetical protein n=1 Tax=Micromonospora echinaurantiaca TaxID=47857 RepID=UPI00378FD7AA